MYTETIMNAKLIMYTFVVLNVSNAQITVYQNDSR